MTITRRSFLMAAPALIAAPVLMNMPKTIKPQILSSAHIIDLWPSLNDHLVDDIQYGLQSRLKAREEMASRWLKELEAYRHDPLS